MNSRQASVKRRIQTQKASFKCLWATLVARDRALQLIEFMVGSKKPTQQPGGKRTPLKLLYGPGIMQLFRQRENDAIMQTKIRERFPIEFARNLAFYINRIRKR